LSNTGRLKPWSALLLAALLLLAQGLGLSHAVAHGGVPAGTLAGEPCSDAPGDAGHDHMHAGHEAGSAECRLVDAHAHGDLALAATLPGVPLAGAKAPLPQHPAGAARPAPRWHPPARGPPR
jgi:hypothetical protein